MRAERPGAGDVAQTTSYAKRNVAETLDGLLAAGLLTVAPVANERRYSLDRDAWARLLGLDLRVAGVPAQSDGLAGEGFWEGFVQTAEAAIEGLRT